MNRKLGYTIYPDVLKDVLKLQIDLYGRLTQYKISIFKVGLFSKELLFLSIRIQKKVLLKLARF